MKKLIILFLFILISISIGCSKKNVLFQLTPYARPNYSPDGESILFSAIVKNKERLILYNIKTQSIKKIFSSSKYCYDPSYSFDGKKIAFIWDNEESEGAEIAIIDADGSNFMKLTSLNFINGYPFFSHDDQRIYFMRSLKPKNNFSLNQTIFGYNIYCININGLEERRINDNIFFYIYSPQCTPDGKYIIFAIDYKENENLYQKIIKYEIKTGEIITIIKGKYNLRPVITKDGKKIIFGGSNFTTKDFINPNTEKEQEEMINGIWSMNMDGSDIKLIMKVNTPCYNLSVSPDDKRVLFMDEFCKIWELNLDGTNLHEINIDQEKILKLFPD